MTHMFRLRVLRGMLATAAGAVLLLSFGMAMDRPLAGEPSATVDPLTATAAEQAPHGALIGGRVVAIDARAGRIEIEFRSMEQYVTMFFQVSDTGLLLGHTPGDKIRFTVLSDGRSRVIDWIENNN